MSSETIHIKQCALIISLRCTLKCKLCLVYAPYYKNPQDYELSQISEAVDMYFKIIDSCGTFNIQGGEPLMHKDLPSIVMKVAEYKHKIGKILVTTNGTLLPSEELLDSLRANRDCIQINISDYGPGLSKKVIELTDILKQNNINYRIINYHGENLHFGGWLDFTDHTLKHHTEEELIANASECGYREGGNIAIRGSELYFCYRVARRIELGIIKKDSDSCVDMFGPEVLEEKRENVRRILNAKYTPACAYCIGKRKEAIHNPPAVQLTAEELSSGVEKV